MFYTSTESVSPHPFLTVAARGRGQIGTPLSVSIASTGQVSLITFSRDEIMLVAGPKLIRIQLLEEIADAANGYCTDLSIITRMNQGDAKMGLELR